MQTEQHHTSGECIQFKGNWTVFPGYMHGLPMPFMVCSLSVALPENFECSILDGILGEYTSAVLPADITEEGSREKSLIARLLYWSAGILRMNRIAVTPAFRVKAGTERPANLEICVSFQSAQATAATIRLLCGCYNELISSAGRPSQAPDANELVTRVIREIEQAVQPLGELGQNQAFFLQIAQTMGIPCKKVVMGMHAFGTGKHMVLLRSTLTSHTSSIATLCAKDKYATSRILRDAGLPGAQHMAIATVEQAIQAARRMGFPVVVKPADLDGGVGVYSNIMDEPTLVKMVEQSRRFSQKTLVEKHFSGDGHRLTIMNGQLVSVTRKVAAGVEGDGVSTIRELVVAEQGRRDAARTSASAYRSALQLDEEALDLLAQYNLHPGSVPKTGEYVILRRKNNAIAGGKSIRLEEAQVHPDNLQLCIHAAELMNLDIAGIDLLIPDIGASWKESGCLICEVNAQPQVGYSTAEVMMRRFFEAGSRIPAFLIVNASRQMVLSETFLLGLAVKLGCNSVSYKSGTWTDGVKSPARFNRSFDAARHVLFCKQTDAALCAVDWAEAGKTGLPLDYFDKIILVHDDESRNLISMISGSIKAHTREIELMGTSQFQDQ